MNAVNQEWWAGSGPAEVPGTPTQTTLLLGHRAGAAADEHYGGLAVSHDVYLGEAFDDVNDATLDSNTFRGNQTATFFVAGFPGYPYPDGLVPGTTYYWRIDEVNDADPNSPWKGDVWSFTTAGIAVIDDFEDYDSGANQIWYSWHDGLNEWR